MLLSLSGFLFEDDYRTQSISPEQFVETAAAAGYRGVELRATQVSPELGPAVTRRWQRLCEQAGLKVSCLVPRFPPTRDAARDQWLDDYLSVAADLQCGLLKLSGELSWMRRAAGMAQSRGMELAVNTHRRTPTATVEGTLRYVRAVDRSNYGVLYDPMHLMLEGEDYLRAIERLHPYLRGVLVQCARRASGTRQGNESTVQKLRIGEPGGQDWPLILQSLRQRGYRRWVTVVENGWPSPSRARIAVETAKRLRLWWDDVGTPVGQAAAVEVQIFPRGRRTTH